jgi:hypothetical protein
MTPNNRIRRLAPLGLAASLCSLAASTSRAETVDASATTMLIVREQLRAGTTVTLAPLYELLSLSARDIRNPVAEDLQLVIAGWGAVSLGDNLVWYDRDRPINHAFGDLDLAYLQGEILRRGVQLRLGRQLVAGGVGGGLQLDGGNVLVRLPFGLGVSAYVGAPVSQRFDTRGTEATFNPQRGNFATGARGYWTLPRWGEVGASWVDVEDHGDPSRRQVGGDLRLTPLRRLTLLANTSYDLHEERWPETNAVAQLQVLRTVLVIADYRHIEPDLLLARNSILAVFVLDRRDEYGGAVRYSGFKAITLDGDYHYLNLQSGDGHRAAARAAWHGAKDTALGVELSGVVTPDNDYIGARVFGSTRRDRLTGTIDLQEYAFDNPVTGSGNGRKNSFIATATLGYILGNGFAALVSGSGGVTPYYESRFDFMAKLAYNQSYQRREVR